MAQKASEFSQLPMSNTPEFYMARKRSQNFTHIDDVNSICGMTLREFMSRNVNCISKQTKNGVVVNASRHKLATQIANFAPHFHTFS